MQLQTITPDRSTYTYRTNDRAARLFACIVLLQCCLATAHVTAQSILSVPGSVPATSLTASSSPAQALATTLLAHMMQKSPVSDITELFAVDVGAVIPSFSPTTIVGINALLPFFEGFNAISGNVLLQSELTITAQDTVGMRLLSTGFWREAMGGHWKFDVPMFVSVKATTLSNGTNVISQFGLYATPPSSPPPNATTEGIVNAMYGAYCQWDANATMAYLDPATYTSVQHIHGQPEERFDWASQRQAIVNNSQVEYPCTLTVEKMISVANLVITSVHFLIPTKHPTRGVEVNDQHNGGYILREIHVFSLTEALLIDDWTVWSHFWFYGQ